VWSLGVLTFMMLYGRPPYFPTKSDGSDFQGLVNAVTKRKHTFDTNVKLSPNGIDFINKCL
jgi:serine/threonine protein kinase